MENNRLDAIQIGKSKVPLQTITLQDRLFMKLPQSLVLDRDSSERYVIFSHREQSPLGIAMRFAPFEDEQSRKKMRCSFFGGDSSKALEDDDRVYFRETRYDTSALSMYLMRFVVEAQDGLLLGCFNCDAAFAGDWREAVLDMLCSVEPAGGRTAL